MSYDTTYKLEWQGSSPTPEEVAQAMAEISDGSTPGQTDYEDALAGWAEMIEEGRTESRWHNHQSEMAELSRRWPRVVFMLSMQGEQGEHHRDYHLDGMVQTVQGEVAFPPFQPSELRRAG